MRKTIRFQVASVAVLLFAGAVSFAQSSGQATYKAKCQSCHGAAGVPSPAMANALKVKSLADPAVKSKSVPQMIEATTNGVGKMPAYKGKLTDAEIKAAVEYFRTLAR